MASPLRVFSRCIQPKHPIKTETADELLVKREPEEEGLIKFEVLPKRERDPPPHLPVDPAENAPPAPSTSTTTRVRHPPPPFTRHTLIYMLVSRICRHSLPLTRLPLLALQRRPASVIFLLRS